MEIVYTVIAVVVVTAIFTYKAMRQRAASWSGEVTKIRKHQWSSDDVDHEEMVISYRTDAGKKGKLKLNPFVYNQLFSDLRVGDRLVKTSGEYMPKIERLTQA